MSQLTFNSFQLDFIDDNISILIPPDEDGLNIDDHINQILTDNKEQEQAQINDNKSVASQSDATTPSNKSLSQMQKDTSNVSNPSIALSESPEIVIKIPTDDVETDHNHISEMLYLAPDQFNNKIQSFMHTYEENENILDDIYK